MKNYLLLLSSLALMGCESDFDKCLSTEIVNTQDIARLQTIKAAPEISAITEEIANVEKETEQFDTQLNRLAENAVAEFIFRKNNRDVGAKPSDPFDEYLACTGEEPSVEEIVSCTNARAQYEPVYEAAMTEWKKTYQDFEKKVRNSLPHQDLVEQRSFGFWFSFSSTHYEAWLEEIGLCAGLKYPSTCSVFAAPRYALLEANDLEGFQNIEGSGISSFAPWNLTGRESEGLKNWIDYGESLTKGANEYLDYLKKKMASLNPNPKDLATKICNARGLYD